MPSMIMRPKVFFITLQNFIVDFAEFIDDLKIPYFAYFSIIFYSVFTSLIKIHPKTNANKAILDTITK